MLCVSSLIRSVSSAYSAQSVKTITRFASRFYFSLIDQLLRNFNGDVDRARTIQHATLGEALLAHAISHVAIPSVSIVYAASISALSMPVPQAIADIDGASLARVKLIRGTSPLALVLDRSLPLLSSSFARLLQFTNRSVEFKSDGIEYGKLAGLARTKNFRFVEMSAGFLVSTIPFQSAEMLENIVEVLLQESVALTLLRSCFLLERELGYLFEVQYEGRRIACSTLDRSSKPLLIEFDIARTGGVQCNVPRMPHLNEQCTLRVNQNSSALAAVELVLHAIE
jgi:hypothetical protein